VEGSRAVCGVQAIALAYAISGIIQFHSAPALRTKVPDPDQCQLLASPPALGLLIALDGSQWIIKLLVIDEPLDSIFSGETLDQSVLVFVNSARQTRRYSRGIVPCYGSTEQV
jgi:hypothetical protein